MDFISILSIFVMACFVGYYVVWSVTPALHTPLMAVTNAISSVIIVGALIAAATAGSPFGQVARSARRGAGERQYLRRLRGHRADAGDVQEEGAARSQGGRRIMATPDLVMPQGGAFQFTDESGRTLVGAVAETAHTVNPWVAVAYLVAGVLFILALRGLSSPATSRTGNRFGMLGMMIAVVTTLVTHFPMTQEMPDSETVNVIIDGRTALEILAAIAIGAAIGLTTARRIAMTAMPQLVAAFHSLVGLAAVLVAVAAFLNPDAFGILGMDGNILTVSRIEMMLGAAIGAITFSGSVIAFAKLNGNMSGAPIMLPARHVINLGTLAAILGGTAVYAMAASAGPGEGWLFWVIVAAAFAIGFLLIIPIGGADMPVVVSMLNSYSGWAAAAMGFTLHNTAMIITGALVGSSGAILSYIMCRAMNRSFISVIAGGFGADGERRGRGQGAAPLQAGQRRPTRPSCSNRPRRSSSSPATAWRWRRRSTRCARWATCSRRRASRSNTPSTRSPGACRGT